MIPWLEMPASRPNSPRKRKRESKHDQAPTKRPAPTQIPSSSKANVIRYTISNGMTDKKTLSFDNGADSIPVTVIPNTFSEPSSAFEEEVCEAGKPTQDKNRRKAVGVQPCLHDSTYHISSQSTYVQDFYEQLPLLTDEILMHELPPSMGTQCSCSSSAIRTVYCEDCTFSEALCTECFLSDHKRNPFHWAHLWEEGAAHGLRVDISRLRNGGYAVPLGHQGGRCPYQSRRPHPPEGPQHDGISFTVATPNGIHGTLLEFCICPGCPSRVQQMMRAKLFPATIKQPIAALSLPTLRSYRCLSFRTKCSAHDFVGALQRLTDNARPWSVSVSLLSLPIYLHSLTRFLTRRISFTTSCLHLEYGIFFRPDSTQAQHSPICPVL